jgi:REP element-mobilizing transposase RayT
VNDLERADRVFQVNCHLIWAIKYRCKVLLDLVEVRLMEVLKKVDS